MKEGWIYEKEYKDKWYKLGRLLFKEWIFFNYSHENTNGIITVATGALIPGKAVIRTFDNGIRTSLEKVEFTETEVKRSTKDNSISMKNNESEISILQDSDDKFRTYGNIGAIKWNLEYTRQAPVFEGVDEKVGWFKILGENLGWQGLMPKAQVTGNVNIPNQKYDINNGLGYVDSNWGTWLIFDSHWNWLQGYGENCSADMFDMRNEKDTGCLYICCNDMVYEFNKNRSYQNKKEYSVDHPKEFWVKDSETGLLRPTKTIITAENEKASLEITVEEIWKNTFTEELKIPFIKYWVMFETFNNIAVKLYDKSTKNEYALSMVGFKEYGLTVRNLGGN